LFDPHFLRAGRWSLNKDRVAHFNVVTFNNELGNIRFLEKFASLADVDLLLSRVRTGMTRPLAQLLAQIVTRPKSAVVHGFQTRHPGGYVFLTKRALGYGV